MSSHFQNKVANNSPIHSSIETMIGRSQKQQKKLILIKDNFKDIKNSLA